MKRFIIAVFVTFVLALLIYNWLLFWSPSAKKAWSNVENSEKLREGMNTKEIFFIMGEPNKTLIFTDSTYIYKAPFAASSGIDIVVKNDRIKKINYYESN